MNTMATDSEVFSHAAITATWREQTCSWFKNKLYRLIIIKKLCGVSHMRYLSITI